MERKPIDTWELAELLESIAKLLKNAPKFTFYVPIKEEPTPSTAKDVQKEEFDYSALTVNQLKSLCKKRGIKGYSKLRKQELIKKLKEKDKGITTIDKISVAFSSETG